VALSHPEERCDRIGADRHADVIETYSLGGCELVLQSGLKLQAPWGRGDGGDPRLTLGQGVVGEPPRLEHLLALQQTLGISPKALDEVFARWQLVEARSQTGEDGTGLGPASRGELEQPLSPGD
jgi:hypothetical protein